MYGAYSHIQSRWANEHTQDNEAAVDLVYMPTPLFDVLGSCYYSFDARGSFWEFALRREQILNDQTVMTLRSILGANEGYISDGHNGLNHVQLRLSLAFYPAARVEIVSYAAYNVPINREPKRFADDLSLHHFFWSGIGVTFHF